MRCLTLLRPVPSLSLQRLVSVACLWVSRLAGGRAAESDWFVAAASRSCEGFWAHPVPS